MKNSILKAIFIMFVFSLTLGIAGCSVGLMKSTVVSYNYPFEDMTYVENKVKQYSADIEAYINDWLAGRVPATIPTSIIPYGTLLDHLDKTKASPEYRNFTLVNPDSITADQQWVKRPAHVLNLNELKGLYPDPHFTYLLTAMYAPFGSTIEIDGKFPKSRYFSINPVGPFNKIVYVCGYDGEGEVPIIDADIDPISGHTNPFRVGADRTVTNRSYKVTLQMAIDNQANYSGPPHYRQAGNFRKAGGIRYLGPGVKGDTIDANNSTHAMYSVGQIWVRYGFPDKYGQTGFDAYAGVGLPKLTAKLADGRKFWIYPDMAYWQAAVDKTRAQSDTNGGDPDDSLPWEGKDWGWRKYFGVYINGFGLVECEGGNYSNADEKTWVRNACLSSSGRGQNQPAPGNWAHSSSHVPHISYIGRRLRVNSGYIHVLTGKLPTVPKTRAGGGTMSAAQARYFSLTTFDRDLLGSPAGLAMTSICDEEITVDSNNKYIIVYSKPADKPANATTANGVTWVDLGKNSDSGFFMRWMSVYPDWKMSGSPDESNLPWNTAEWSSPSYDNSRIGNNSRTGYLGEYLPKSNYMTKKCFEDLGSPVTWAKVDGVAWKCNTSTCGAPVGKSTPYKAVGIFIPLLVSIIIGGLCVIRRKR